MYLSILQSGKYLFFIEQLENEIYFLINTRESFIAFVNWRNVMECAFPNHWI